LQCRPRPWVCGSYPLPRLKCQTRRVSGVITKDAIEFGASRRMKHRSRRPQRPSRARDGPQPHPPVPSHRDSKVTTTPRLSIACQRREYLSIGDVLGLGLPLASVQRVSRDPGFRIRVPYGRRLRLIGQRSRGAHRTLGSLSASTARRSVTERHLELVEAVGNRRSRRMGASGQRRLSMTALVGATVFSPLGL
jgi:hypothetical protein